MFNVKDDVEQEGAAFRKYMDVLGIISATEASKETDALSELEIRTICANEHLLDLWENCTPVETMRAEVLKVQGRAQI